MTNRLIVCVSMYVTLSFIVGCAYPELARFDDAYIVSTDASLATDADQSFVPTHLTVGQLVAFAPDTFLNAPMNTIDTTNLTINGMASPYFVQRGPIAVLFTKMFSVQTPVQIVGNAPLLIAASDKIAILANMDLSGTSTVNGPGGISIGQGSGLAGSTIGKAPNRDSSGGGGGSYGTLGSKGGSGGTSDPQNFRAGGGIGTGKNQGSCRVNVQAAV